MDGMIQFFEDKLVPIAAKIGNQRHLVAIRDAFAALMPLVMAGAIALLLNNVVFSSGGLIATLFKAEESGFFQFTGKYISPVLGAMDAGTLSILGLALVFTIAYLRAQFENQDALITGTIAMGSFIILGALSRQNLQIAGWVGHYLGSQGVFVALIVGLIAPAIYFAIVNKNWTIKMPDTVPPAVTRGFMGIIPGFIVLLIFAIVKFVIASIGWGGLEEMFGEAALSPSIFMLFEVYIAKPFASISQGPVLIIVISVLIPLLWFFGLHGANLLAAVMSPIYGTLGTHNLQAFEKGITAVSKDPLGQNTLAYWVSGSWDAYVFHGGSGATLPLIIAILLFSKVRDQKEVARLSLAPGIFMINEPVLFGIPIVLNPIYIIPFVLNQPILAMVAYGASLAGFAGPIVNSVPWTTPPILNALLATNFSMGAGVIAALNLVIAFVIYVPFVMVANNADAKINAA
ncbi:PTS sugar transporter subunit IIC [Erysipelothrix sp. HDW6C]|uniref:PTS sugar transporter subunit IIC n=1 Tax=Erysipelothrix sp. HDW6C TaxID=2714930 RepID=UPI00140AC058|nr:PTS transporter subunit EIIC [Erysipelothrix sp. HDW6C]QIK70523.1 PTS sugar transporter subunit IIC [Erysipelothrix sp. HDW6C]